MHTTRLLRYEFGHLKLFSAALFRLLLALLFELVIQHVEKQLLKLLSILLFSLVETERSDECFGVVHALIAFLQEREEGLELKDGRVLPV